MNNYIDIIGFDNYCADVDGKRELFIDNSSIVKCCRLKNKSAGGFKWTYLGEDLPKGEDK